MEVLKAQKIDKGYSWTLTTRLADMLEKSTEIYGPKDNSYTILGIEFEENGPQIWYPFSSRYIAIQLSYNSMDDMVSGCYELAHESVHLLSPLGNRGASVLEEGLATKFAVDYVQKEFSYEQTINKESYQNAYDLVCQLLEIDEFAIKNLREHEFVISKFTPELLLRLYPTLEEETAIKLCSTFVRDAT